jgi:hypothetical protein
VNILSVIQKQIELKGSEVKGDAAAYDVSATHLEGRIQSIQDNLVHLNLSGISVFDTCAALAVIDPEARSRFIQLVLKDQS